MRKAGSGSLFLLTLFTLLIIAGGVWGAEFTYSGGRYPNTEMCTDTPTIDFPDNVTISKTYLMVANCPTPADFNHGDFVSVWIEDMEGSPIESVSEFVETEQGVIWISPLADNMGQAWEHIEFSPEKYDCNSTGVPYSIALSWDDQTAAKTFNIYCPQLELKRYKSEVPWTEGLIASVEVTDNIGNRMKGIPCSSRVLYVEDENTISIRQRTEVIETDLFGTVEFEYAAGFISAMYINYEYDIVIECLGADVNFVLTVVEPDSQAIRNPAYFLLVWLSDMWVPIIFGMLICSLLVGAFYLIVKDRD